MKLIKLTNKNNKTRFNTKWGKGVTNCIQRKLRNNKTCSNGVLHAYTDINLALLLNPIHSAFKKFNIWECEGSIAIEQWDKVGVHKLTTIKQLKLPNWYLNDETRKKVCVYFAVLCAREVLPDLDKRPKKAIDIAEKSIHNPISPDDIYKAADAAYYAAYYAANAANTAYYAAYAAAYAAYYAANPARAAIAAHYAARAADAAYNKDKNINFKKLAQEAVNTIEIFELLEKELLK